MISHKPVLLFNQVRTAPADHVQPAVAQTSSLVPNSESAPVSLNQRHLIQKSFTSGAVPKTPLQSSSNPLTMSSVATGTHPNDKAVRKKSTKTAAVSSTKRQLNFVPPKAKSKLAKKSSSVSVAPGKIPADEFRASANEETVPSTNTALNLPAGAVTTSARTVTQWHAPESDLVASAAAMSFRRATRTKRPNVPLHPVDFVAPALLNKAQNVAKSLKREEENNGETSANQASHSSGRVPGRQLRHSERHFQQLGSDRTEIDAHGSREAEARSGVGAGLVADVSTRRKSARLATRSRSANRAISRSLRTRATSEGEARTRRHRREQDEQHESGSRKRRRASLSGRSALAETIGVREIRRPRKGDRVEILWEDRNQTFEGFLRKRASKRGWIFEVKYDDGDELIEDLDDVHWRLLPDGAWVEPGDLGEGARDAEDRSFAPGSKGAQDVSTITKSTGENLGGRQQRTSGSTLEKQENGVATILNLASTVRTGTEQNHNGREVLSSTTNKQAARVAGSANEADGMLDEDTVELEVA